MILRAAFLIFQNEFRLLAKDRVGLFILLLAPIVIIAVAGFSLGNIYGAHPKPGAWVIPVVDRDHGPLAQAILQALGAQPSVIIERPANVAEARHIVLRDPRAAIAITIPEGASAMLKNGQTVHLTIYVDPTKRIEADAVELRLTTVCERTNTATGAETRIELAAKGIAARDQLDRIAGEVAALRARVDDYQRHMVSAKLAAERDLQQQLDRQIADLQASTTLEANRSMVAMQAALTAQLEARQRVVVDATSYLQQLQAAKLQFQEWFEHLKALAGSHAQNIPPPPQWPTPPADLTLLSQPLKISLPAPSTPEINPPRLPSIALPLLPSIDQLLPKLPAIPLVEMPILPGQLGWTERSLTGGETRINAFDQYVPGFGITFLLIGMLMGISLRLIEDRDWGTLQRLRVSGAPLAGMLIGKLLSRFLVGLAQLTILFAIGWWLFGISLGRDPLALFLPALAISFAAAAFGLIIACLARTHDSVMPIGAVFAMAMSAIGGCWWPLSFEPSWMRAFGLLMPTTWTMQAFNDLMIRNLPPSEILLSTAATVGLGVLFVTIGLVGASRLYRG
jgi:ABC-type multidrug transport system permease subunit